MVGSLSSRIANAASGPLNFSRFTTCSERASMLRLKVDAALAEHKELINQFETFEGVRLGTKDLILEAVDNEYLSKIEHVTLGYLNRYAGGHHRKMSERLNATSERTEKHKRRSRIRSITEIRRAVEQNSCNTNNRRNDEESHL